MSEAKIPRMTEETFFTQICDELKNTLYYDDLGRPLRSMDITARAFPNKISSSHALVSFPGVGAFLLSVKKVR